MGPADRYYEPHDVGEVECPNPDCGEMNSSPTCWACGASVPSPDELTEDAEYAAADAAYDAMREGGY